MKKRLCSGVAGKFLCLILCVLLVVPSTSPFHTNASPVVFAESEALYGNCEASTFYTALYNHLVSTYGYEFAHNYFMAESTVNNILNSFPMSRMGTIMFPDYFGGVYIDDYGNANVLIVDSPMNRANMGATMSYAQQFDTTAVRAVAFSYNELWDTMHALNYVLLNYPENEGIQNSSGWRIDVVGNRVVVQLTDFTDCAVVAFSETVFYSPVVVFEQAWGLMIADAPTEDIEDNYHSTAPRSIMVDPGDSFLFGSVGYRATWNGRPGFVTAAHVVSFEGQFTVHGNVRVRSLPGLDAAFVELHASHSMSNRLFTTTHTSRSMHPLVGQWATNRGRNSPNVARFSPIRHVSYTNPAISTLINVVLVDNAMHRFASPGDSGGAVLGGTQNNVSTLRGPFDVLGIVQGGWYVESNGVWIPHYGVVSPAWQIAQWLNVFPQ